MESQVVRRRINMIASHFAPNDDVSATHILPMNCSSSLNSVIRRCDNSMYFARQGSCSQAFFMRQVSIEQANLTKSGEPLKCSGSVNGGSCNASQEPLFSKPARIESNFQNFGARQPVVQDYSLSVPDIPKFARPNRTADGQKQFCSNKKQCSSESSGIEWSPRMDVVESGHSYRMTVEIPGVSINDIKVEVNDQNLKVMGKRSTQYWKVTGCSNDPISTYHKREILQGPYQVVWPLPTNVNKDSVSAEFVDGILLIVIPKL